MKKVKYLFVIAFVMMLSVFIRPASVHADDDIRPQSVAISATNKTVYRGSTFTVSAKYSPARADDDYLYWAIVGRKGIVQFADDDRSDNSVKLKALRTGTTKLRCHIKGTSRRDYITITVKNRPSKPQRVSIPYTSRTMYRGSTLTLKANYGPSGTNENYLYWAIVGKKGIVQIVDKDVSDNDIRIKALRTGTTRLRCHIKGTSRRDYITITVKNRPSPKPQRVNISLTRKTLYTGSTYTLKASYAPSNANQNYLNWAIVGKKGIVQFAENDIRDNDVRIKALRPGTTKLRCHVIGTSRRDYITITVKNRPVNYNIYSYGSITKTVEAGDDFELRVRRSSSLSERYLRWSIRNTNIVTFDDDDRIDDEVEFEARRVGTTTVTCRNLKTNRSVTYTIRVIPDRDDDRDDDD